MEANHSSHWLPLGSAHVIDWKHLGRPASARGATVWLSQIEGDPVLLRAWGEETTSFFDFVFLGDERLVGNIVVTCTRAEGGKLRLKTALEVETLLSYTDTNEFKEHPRTLLLGHLQRTLDLKAGTLPPSGPPRLSAGCAEIFEIAPDSALQTSCGAWLSAVLRAVRDQIQGREGVAAEHRSKTERSLPVRPAARETVNGAVRRSVAPEQKRDPAPEPQGRSKAREPQKLTCTTNSGESFEIANDETYIGRSKQCAIVLKSQRVSRKHACVTREADGYYINDLGAANGIWQGSEKIDREKIKAGDEYIVGDVVLSFNLA